MKSLKATFVVLSLLLQAVFVHAQAGGKTVIGETMRSNGRIYVVVAVMTTILIGLFIYLIRLDRKISTLEKEK